MDKKELIERAGIIDALAIANIRNDCRNDHAHTGHVAPDK